MNKLRPLIDWFIRHRRLGMALAGLVLIVAWVGGVFDSKVAPRRLPAEPGVPVPPGAATLVVSNVPVALSIDAVGTVASEKKINLSARIPAYVKDVFVSAGMPVKAGQLLLTLDDREIREQLTAAEAQLKQAESEFQRAKQLYSTKATTEQALVAAESMFNTARAQADRVRVMMSYAQVASPIDGIVTDRRIEAGDLANPGQLLLAVYDPNNMRLEAPVPVRLIDNIKLGQELEVSLDRLPHVVTGQVAQIVSEIDPMSRTQIVKVHLEGVSGDVLPGTFGRLWIPQERRSMILAPAEAVARVGQIEMVRVVADGRVIRRMVKTGITQKGRVEIISGLQDGDTILIRPAKED